MSDKYKPSEHDGVKQDGTPDKVSLIFVLVLCLSSSWSLFSFMFGSSSLAGPYFNLLTFLPPFVSLFSVSIALDPAGTRIQSASLL